jgi:hypothetical protein
MEFKLNGFTYKTSPIKVAGKTLVRVLKYIKSRKGWKHMVAYDNNGFVYFTSKGKNYKINLETYDLYQGKNFIENLYDEEEEIVLKGSSI